MPKRTSRIEDLAEDLSDLLNDFDATTRKDPTTTAEDLEHLETLKRSVAGLESKLGLPPGGRTYPAATRYLTALLATTILAAVTAALQLAVIHMAIWVVLAVTDREPVVDSTDTLGGLDFQWLVLSLFFFTLMFPKELRKAHRDKRYPRAKTVRASSV